MVTQYLEVDTLTPFNGSYQLMSVEQQIELADHLLQQCKPYERILVIETGVAPLVFIMQELLKKQDQKIDFFHLKIPREMTPDQFPTLLPSFPQLMEFISKPFLILDEYIDSGHTINLVRDFLRSIQCKDHYRLMAYMHFCQIPELKSLLHYACTENHSKEELFTKGVYPFENRMDYVPYFYHSSRKTSLSEFLISRKPDEKKQSLKDITPFLQKVREAIPISCVADFISINHLYLYSLYCMEKDPLRKQFFWNLFDMIGPFWTPLPKEYHFSYWKGFESIHAEFSDYLVGENIDLEYKAHEVACHMLERHHHWTAKVMRTIEAGLHVC